MCGGSYTSSHPSTELVTSNTSSNPSTDTASNSGDQWDVLHRVICMTNVDCTSSERCYQVINSIYLSDSGSCYWSPVTPADCYCREV